MKKEILAQIHKKVMNGCLEKMADLCKYFAKKTGTCHWFYMWLLAGMVPHCSVLDYSLKGNGITKFGID